VRASRRAFTLLEVVLVLAVLVIVSALVIPSIAPMYRSFRLSASADTMRAAFATARSQAIEEGRPYRVGVVFGSGNFRVAPNDEAYWSGGGSAGEGECLMLEDALASGVAIYPPGESGGFGEDGGETSAPAGEVGVGSYETVAVFLPDGTAVEDSSLDLFASGLRTRVTLRSLTGAVTARRIYAGEEP
jgi:prepilin-type N-terminal cleavage/methylation domain-containing protein